MSLHCIILVKKYYPHFIHIHHHSSNKDFLCDRRFFECSSWRLGGADEIEWPKGDISSGGSLWGFWSPWKWLVGGCCGPTPFGTKPKLKDGFRFRRFCTSCLIGGWLVMMESSGWGIFTFFVLLWVSKACCRGGGLGIIELLATHGKWLKRIYEINKHITKQNL